VFRRFLAEVAEDRRRTNQAGKQLAGAPAGGQRAHVKVGVAEQQSKDVRGQLKKTYHNIILMFQD
jgi:hypothetical protein